MKNLNDEVVKLTDDTSPKFYNQLKQFDTYVLIQMHKLTVTSLSLQVDAYIIPDNY